MLFMFPLAAVVQGDPEGIFRKFLIYQKKVLPAFWSCNFSKKFQH